MLVSNDIIFFQQTLINPEYKAYFDKLKKTATNSQVNG